MSEVHEQHELLKILEVRQRVSTVVLVEKYDPETEKATRSEIVTHTVDRALPIPYDQ